MARPTTLAENRRVLIDGNLITSIGDASIEGVKHSEVIDCGGRTLMSRLIDSHNHFNMNAPGGLAAVEAMRWDDEYLSAVESFHKLALGSARRTQIKEPIKVRDHKESFEVIYER